MEPAMEDQTGAGVTEGGGGGGGSSGAVSDIPRSNVSLPRDSARGKGAVIAEVEESTDIPVEYREEDIAF
ncbi:hypothetical protein RHMOL_Rhmol11G0057900 [Rhododendron molle]|uniref:Uncharacterized protein n=1 Tax=Rhododendron molle TaxID=49168 RepID=A0ACC0LQ16_RHOML|nr:hypothetical protein RHMOL_Rhmol11G0057900 [Rhododendron molle]